MDEEAMLHDRLRKIEAVFARPGSEGERIAAEAARERLRRRLEALPERDPSIEMAFALGGQWSRWLFLTVFHIFAAWEPYRRPEG
jgi:hypothetical protein